MADFECVKCHNRIPVVDTGSEVFNGEHTSAVVVRHPPVRCVVCGQHYMYLIQGIREVVGAFVAYAGPPDASKVIVPGITQ